MRLCKSLLICAVILFLTAGILHATPPTTRPAPLSIFVAFRDGFRILYPHDWEVANANTKSGHPWMFATDKGCVLLVEVMKGDASSASLNSYSEQWIMSNLANGSNKVLTDGTIKIDGAPARRIVLTSTDGDSANRTMATIVARKSRIYVILYSASNAADFEKGLPEVDQMLQSIKWFQVPPRRTVRNVFY